MKLIGLFLATVITIIGFIINPPLILFILLIVVLSAPTNKNRGKR